jgi:hypothetical protein
MHLEKFSRSTGSISFLKWINSIIKYFKLLPYSLENQFNKIFKFLFKIIRNKFFVALPGNKTVKILTRLINA